MECIDHWLANHTTCPLCRLSLIPAAKVSSESPNNQVETDGESFLARNIDETTVQSGQEYSGESQTRQLSEPHNEDYRTLHNAAGGEEGRSGCAAEGREDTDDRQELEEYESMRRFSAK